MYFICLVHYDLQGFSPGPHRCTKVDLQSSVSSGSNIEMVANPPPQLQLDFYRQRKLKLASICFPNLYTGNQAHAAGVPCGCPHAHDSTEGDALTHADRNCNALLPIGHNLSLVPLGYAPQVIIHFVPHQFIVNLQLAGARAKVHHRQHVVKHGGLGGVVHLVVELILAKAGECVFQPHPIEHDDGHLEVQVEAPPGTALAVRPFQVEGVLQLRESLYVAAHAPSGRLRWRVLFALVAPGGEAHLKVGPARPLRAVNAVYLVEAEASRHLKLARAIHI